MFWYFCLNHGSNGGQAQIKDMGQSPFAAVNHAQWPPKVKGLSEKSDMHIWPSL